MNARTLLVLGLVLWGVTACQRTTNLVSSRVRDGGDGGDGGNGADAGARDAGPPIGLSDAGVVLCGDTPCACANGLDDDGDGFVDGFDGECTGPYDQDEATFATGEVKEGNPNCADCFFDGNPSSNDDGCNIATQCGIDGTSTGAPGACRSCEPSTQCTDSCLPRTPNGCDCFGCCEVTGLDMSLAIQLVDTCSLDLLPNEDACPRCLPSMDCQNPCGRCELCPGKTQDQLPADCAGAFTCDDGQSCTSDASCPSPGYCAQGCCVPVVL